jgi:hypothetical protein
MATIGHVSNLTHDGISCYINPLVNQNNAPIKGSTLPVFLLSGPRMYAADPSKTAAPLTIL